MPGYVKTRHWVAPEDQEALRRSLENALCDLMGLCQVGGSPYLSKPTVEGTPVAKVVVHSEPKLDSHPTLEATITLYVRPASEEEVEAQIDQAVELFSLTRREMGGDCSVPTIFLDIPTKRMRGAGK